MRGIRYRKRVDGVASCLFFYFVIHLVTLFVMGADNVSVSSSGKKSRTFSDLLNIVGGLGGGGGKPEDKTFFGEDADGNEILVGTWFQYGSYTLATAMFGTGFLVACAATAVYYVLFVVTDPRQSGLTKSKRRWVKKLEIKDFWRDFWKFWIFFSACPQRLQQLIGLVNYLPRWI